MKLIKVETKGFKSFADRTILNFDGGVVGIVGPNGSGKSNINDAIKWVLGESSAKSLRGSNMEDVIFAGSKTVAPMNKAEVTLTFDNSDGYINIPHKKFSVSRVITRGVGGSEYFINGEKSRKSDINIITMKMGISKNSLAIISQGTISNIAQATPEQRRGIFEEAAGISVYKSRKKIASKKLELTRDAIEKLRLAMAEQEKRLTPLRKQKEKAEKYLTFRDELKDVEIALLAKEINYYQTRYNELAEELQSYESTKEDYKSQIKSLDVEIKSLTKTKNASEADRNRLSQDIQDLIEKISEAKIKRANASNRRQMIINGEMNASSTEKLNAMKAEIDELAGKINYYEENKRKLQDKIDVNKNELSTLSTTLSQKQQDHRILDSKRTKLKAKLLFRIEQRDKRSNLNRGVNTIVKNSSIIEGYKGIVADLIDVPSEYNNAMETALKGKLQNIVVASTKGAEDGVRFLKKNKAGRATFIPLNTIQPKSVREDQLTILKNQNGFIGVASTLISADPVYGILLKFLLGSIIVVDTVESGNILAKLVKHRYTFVTLDGDTIRSGGIITGGDNSRGNQMLGIENDIKKLEHALPIVDEKLTEQKAELRELKNKHDELGSLIGGLNNESFTLLQKIKFARESFNVVKAKYEAETDSKVDVSDADEYDVDDVEILNAKLTSLKTESKVKKDAILRLSKDLNSAMSTKNEFDNSLRDLIENGGEKVTESNQAEYIMNSHLERLSEEYQLTAESAIEQYTLSMPEDEASILVKDLRGKIKSLGHVNIDAIEEFNEVDAQYQKRVATESELFNAFQAIMHTIATMDKIIIDRLDETFQLVNKEMGIIFKTMFGGGFAELKYTDPKNLLETGVDVIAQPPGKTVKNLNLFSGGEKALVAISLLFAIIKTKPLPLCLLDEVEAALDDANVARYATFLQELKDKTQFLVVTHRVGTMSRVDHLFGATMQKRGVTSFFTVELEKAKELIGD